MMRWIRKYAPVFVLVIPIFSPMAGSAESQSWELFGSASGAGVARLTRIDAAQSGLEVSSLYKDPRAWGERLSAGTIGTVGTGIGVGDFDSDGFPDMFVAMREGLNRIYMGEDGGRFTDRSKEAGVLASPDWTTGVTVADINGDGSPDIYVCFFDAPNRLYLNRGDGTFEERAAAFNLAIRDASSGAFFADYDKDGDLDLYLQTNIKYEAGGRPDYFLRNEGEAGFADVTEEVGILVGSEGSTLGHSVLWHDYDEDGWEDLYVGNDFRMPDFLYLNKGDGTFRFAPDRIPVAPYSSMGSDVGDVTGNGRLDVLTTDMATTTYMKHVESMLTSAVKTGELEPESRPRQTMKNALLLNRGGGDYIDVAYAWNLAATDWTWAPRLIDLDNDGWLDAFFTNGMIRQFHNADLALAQDRQVSLEAKTAVFRRSPVLREENLVYRNVEGRGFEAANALWHFKHKGVSFGAATFDFDRDGDLDMVYTNYEEPPTLWRNDIGSGNAVQIHLAGRGKNTEAIGATAIARFGDRVQAQKVLSNRGYLGSDEKLLHFGLGESVAIDSLEIQWPDGENQVALDLKAGRRYRITQQSLNAESKLMVAGEDSSRFVWEEELESSLKLPVAGAEPAGAGLLYPFKLIPKKAEPKMIREDLNGDGQNDVLIIREWASPRLLLSGESGIFDASETSGFDGLSGIWERVIIYDFNGDGRLDVFFGGLGINNDVSHRSAGEGKMQRTLGRFRGKGPLVNLNAYEWGGELRLYDGLREYSGIDGSVSAKIKTFGETGILDSASFIEKVGFEAEKIFNINRFRSGIMLNEGEGRFRFEALPMEGQYGRVWDAVVSDLNEDGVADLILLLGQVSPHARASQNESSIVIILLGQGDGSFLADERRALDRPPASRSVGLILEPEMRLVLQLENSGRATYRLRN